MQCWYVPQHLGGIHSGCALSGVIWLLFKVVNNFRKLNVTHDAVLVMGVVTNLAVMISALSAFPWVRNTHHKYVNTAAVSPCHGWDSNYVAFSNVITDLLDGWASSAPVRFTSISWFGICDHILRGFCYSRRYLRSGYSFMESQRSGSYSSPGFLVHDGDDHFVHRISLWWEPQLTPFTSQHRSALVFCQGGSYRHWACGLISSVAYGIFWWAVM